MKTLPKIRISPAKCCAYGTCYSANNPYYSGHYRTKEQAMAAAEKRKLAFEAKRARDDEQRGER